MNDRQTARIIGDHVALTSPAAMLWRRVSQSELTIDEVAAQLGCPVDERERAKAIFTAPTPEQRQRQLDALLVRIDQTAPRPLPQPKRWGTFGVALLILSVAAAAVLMLAPPPPAVESVQLAMHYTVDPLRGIAVQLGSMEPRIPTYLPSSRLKVVLRPNEDVTGPIGAVGFARGSSGATRRLTIHPDVLANGVVEIETTAEDAGLVAGLWELVFVVGRPDTLPTAWETIEGRESSQDDPHNSVLPPAKIRVLTKLGGK